MDLLVRDDEERAPPLAAGRLLTHDGLLVGLVTVLESWSRHEVTDPDLRGVCPSHTTRRSVTETQLRFETGLDL